MGMGQANIHCMNRNLVATVYTGPPMFNKSFVKIFILATVVSKVHASACN